MDRDGDGEMEERRSIRDSSRKLKKYGSTSRHMTRNEHLIKYIISKTDTLQGIALKYGVTTEQIRRINKMWATDSLFLREHLLVPVPADSGASFIDSAYSSTDGNAALSDNFTSTPVTSPNYDDDEEDGGASITNFLAKMDSSIETVKDKVKRVQGNSEFCWDGDTSYSPPARRGLTRSRHSRRKAGSSLGENVSSDEWTPTANNDHLGLPSAVVMTQGRRVKTSLQKLQQQQDEIFQL